MSERSRLFTLVRWSRGPIIGKKSALSDIQTIGLVQNIYTLLCVHSRIFFVTTSPLLFSQSYQVASLLLKIDFQQILLLRVGHSTIPGNNQRVSYWVFSVSSYTYHIKLLLDLITKIYDEYVGAKF